MSKTIKIGTRDSELALWQAHTVEKRLNDLGYQTEIISVKSTGDIILDKPLYELGITGIFTKTLDIAMLKGEVDIAVHSMKDVPTALPKGIVQAAVLERASTLDILVHKGDLSFLETSGIIASGSLRRKAQWLNKYPTHQVEDLRGNVNTRMQKLKESNWKGAVFAAAGLERINLKPETFINLDWMIPAPAQGAMVVVAMEDDSFSREALTHLNHKPSEICTFVERQFLKTLEGGCTAPIGALATIDKNQITLKGVLFSLDGKEKLVIEKTINNSLFENFGELCATEILENGGSELMQTIKTALNQKH
ncbi:hydroxymethylbilane synthase [Flavobacterium piscinae]|uniref:Hydroxymethylbilane synthase n=1 Tax=Flavobacterium piscinae TaxID=2506424 RepID=A0A4Q1KXI3_9FLAO|nr:hydroxymethylbilane synthase [Flavobacterium piscinae]MBC8883578.1 hydroxymethylbilane synthase [Flavobacterium piscinae]RXR34209.1 hydroxymethylbilane synthase [Flavobacterium piscinae]